MANWMTHSQLNFYFVILYHFLKLRMCIFLSTSSYRVLFIYFLKTISCQQVSAGLESRATRAGSPSDGHGVSSFFLPDGLHRSTFG